MFRPGARCARVENSVRKRCERYSNAAAGGLRLCGRRSTVPRPRACRHRFGVFCATLGSRSDRLRMRRDDHPQSNLRPRSIWPARADCPEVLAVHPPMQRWPSKIRSRQRGLQPCHVPEAAHPHGPKSQEAGAQRKRQPVRVTDARCPPVDASPVHWSRWQRNWFRVGAPLRLICQPPEPTRAWEEVGRRAQRTGSFDLCRAFRVRLSGMPA